MFNHFTHKINQVPLICKDCIRKQTSLPQLNKYGILQKMGNNNEKKKNKKEIVILYCFNMFHYLVLLANKNQLSGMNALLINRKPRRLWEVVLEVLLMLDKQKFQVSRLRKKYNTLLQQTEP